MVACALAINAGILRGNVSNELTYRAERTYPSSHITWAVRFVGRKCGRGTQCAESEVEAALTSLCSLKDTLLVVASSAPFKMIWGTCGVLF